MVRTNYADENVFETLGALAQLGDDAVDNNSAFVDDGDPFTKALYNFQDVRCEKNRSALPDLIDQDVFHQARAYCVDSFERLVHQK